MAKAGNSCCRHGPGYASPLDAMKNGPREKLLYIIAVQPDLKHSDGDYLATVDVDPTSSTYSQVIHRTYTKAKGNELHHSGWNTCSSCYEVKDQDVVIPKRDKLVCPALNSNRVYVFDMSQDERKPVLYRVIDSTVLNEHNVSAPHTTHCMYDGTVLISTMGDRDDNAKGDFIQFDNQFNCLGTWARGDKQPDCGYDFWYQPHFDVLVASEWGAPKLFKRGFKMSDIENPKEYGRTLNFYRLSDHKLFQTIDLGTDGITPLEVRFLHDPLKAIGFVGCALNSNLYCFYRPNENDEQFVCEKVVDIPNKKLSVDGVETEIGGMMADILLSLDDKWLYMNNWLHGDVRQYDISNPKKPILKGQLFLGGVANRKPNVRIVDDKELDYEPKPVFMKGRQLEGAPQMLQLSLDGKRLYASSSLYSPWDRQFYPDMVAKGGHVVLIDVDTEEGGLTLNPDFFVDFGAEPNGPALPHEIRYPGGDCTSEVWLAQTANK
ncbi:methanethiol oxidase [Sitodiplosis mosellana]|uniref:methanethiol oxidase n=1 Tax=Sitodiplosis mosellana TaxID=263140 RepID=UPI002443C68F|nr:methanethiol oxidase [Sitodiplosis mosellana]